MRQKQDREKKDAEHLEASMKKVEEEVRARGWLCVVCVLCCVSSFVVQQPCCFGMCHPVPVWWRRQIRVPLVDAACRAPP